MQLIFDHLGPVLSAAGFAWMILGGNKVNATQPKTPAAYPQWARKDLSVWACSLYLMAAGITVAFCEPHWGIMIGLAAFGVVIWMLGHIAFSHLCAQQDIRENTTRADT